METPRRYPTILALAWLFLHEGGCSDNAKPTVSSDEITHICAHIVSCGPSWGEQVAPSAMTTCVDSKTNDKLQKLGTVNVDEYFQCYLSAGKDCEELMKCDNGGHGVESCDVSTFEKHCEGNMKVTCLEGKIRYDDCSKYEYYFIHPACRVDEAGGNVSCVGEPCSGDSSSCSGNTLVRCEGGSSTKRYCSLFEEICDDLPSGGAACMGTGAECEKDRCEETKAVSCDGGREAVMDCSVVLGPGYTCHLYEAESKAVCVPGGVECDVHGNADTCDGSFLVFCRGGSIDRVDCGDLGYGRCVSEGGAAYCR
jgi:hypothetical protein